MKMLLFTTFVFLMGCATQAITGMLRFQDRELLIHPDKPALAYPYHETVCVDRAPVLRWMGKKCHQEQRMDEYDMNDKAVREKLINAVFTCKSAGRFKY